MSTQESRPEREPLSTGQRIIVVLHVMLAGALFVSGSVDPGGDGFSDLARLAVLLIVGLYLLATATVTAIARFLMSASVLRYALIALGPPTLMAIAVLFVRAA